MALPAARALSACKRFEQKQQKVFEVLKQLKQISVRVFKSFGYLHSGKFSRFSLC